MAADADVVNHPPHYTAHPSGVECIEITENMGFCLGNAMKYAWRAGMKNGDEDVAKCAWYVRREIDRRKGHALRGDAVDSYVPDTLVDRFRAVMAHETGARGQVISLLFHAHQSPLAVKPLFDVLVYVDELRTDEGVPE